MNTIDAGAWSGDWGWSLPLIALNLVVHVFGLGLCNESGAREHFRFVPTQKIWPLGSGGR
jgi:hypothetical protein